MKPPEAGGAMSESLALVAPGRPKLDNQPVGLFGSVMGVTGLSVAWQLAHVRYGVPEVIALVIAAVAVVAFVLLVAGYAIKLVTAFSAVQEEFRHPVAGNLFGTILISLLQLPIVVEPFAHRLAQFFWTAGAAGMVSKVVGRGSALRGTLQGGRSPRTPRTPNSSTPSICERRRMSAVLSWSPSDI
jgi:hypothetical protein